MIKARRATERHHQRKKKKKRVPAVLPQNLRRVVTTSHLESQALKTNSTHVPQIFNNSEIPRIHLTLTVQSGLVRIYETGQQVNVDAGPVAGSGELVKDLKMSGGGREGEVCHVWFE